ncbi:hypothetical protein NEIPOLOT_02091 [Neisseria polysaccharea ATCC 43768]|nr:hypothetical protein NEIPOLOT_02091 [Neisseria polysaccharea ATCC 43768]
MPSEIASRAFRRHLPPYGQRYFLSGSCAKRQSYSFFSSGIFLTILPILSNSISRI